MMEKMNKHTMMQNWLLSIIKARIQSFVDLENYCQVPEKKKKKKYIYKWSCHLSWESK